MAADDSLDVIVRDRALYVPVSDTLIIADLHFGRELAANIEYPLRTNANMLDRVSDLLDHFTPQLLVVAGDVVHSFSNITPHIRMVIEDLLDIIAGSDVSLVVVKGNHDSMLETIPEIECRSEFPLPNDATVICHGHEPPEQHAERYIVGHDHPAIVIEGHRRPCFLYGPCAYDGSDVIVLPAFNRLTPGVPINNRRAARGSSPFIGDLGAFQPIVYDAATEEPLHFPPLGEFQSLL